jgi:GSH-dependent disulfide-bond oxidoreductase
MIAVRFNGVTCARRLRACARTVVVATISLLVVIAIVNRATIISENWHNQVRCVHGACATAKAVLLPLLANTRAWCIMIDLHTVATANGYKASIMLEEVGAAYRVTSYDLIKGQNLTPDFLALNPVGRLPVIVDHDESEAGGAALSVYGSMPILVYLAEKHGKLLPANGPARARVFEWLGTVSSDVAPAYSGQFVFNVIASEKQPWAVDYYNKLCARMLRPLDLRLATSQYLAGDAYTIADIIAYPVAAISAMRYPGSLEQYPSIARWAGVVGARPAVQRGLKVPS